MASEPKDSKGRIIKEYPKLIKNEKGKFLVQNKKEEDALNVSGGDKSKTSDKKQW